MKQKAKGLTGDLLKQPEVVADVIAETPIGHDAEAAVQRLHPPEGCCGETENQKSGNHARGGTRVSGQSGQGIDTTPPATPVSLKGVRQDVKMKSEGGQ